MRDLVILSDLDILFNSLTLSSVPASPVLTGASNAAEEFQAQVSLHALEKIQLVITLYRDRNDERRHSD